MNKSKSVVLTPSRFGHRTRVFYACDDGSRICFGCAEPMDGRVDAYGPARKTGVCYNCGFHVEHQEDLDRLIGMLGSEIRRRERPFKAPQN